jgi:transposase InsO family protein
MMAKSRGFRIWSLRGNPDLSVRTVERIMALNRQVSTDIPGTEALHTRPAPPQPHPFKATVAHEYWFIDGRMMDFALQGHRWWSLIILDGSSRTMLAGAVAPSEASWVALTVLYTACQRYGVPVHLISDSGGAFISDAFEGVCTRLDIDHQTIVSTQGQSYMNLMETHFNIQRRLYDYQLALTRTPWEFDEAHQRFLALYNTTAHQGLRKERFASPTRLVTVSFTYMRSEADLIPYVPAQRAAIVALAKLCVLDAAESEDDRRPRPLGGSGGSGRAAGRQSG